MRTMTIEEREHVTHDIALTVIINDIFDQFNFNVKIPSGERNYMKQPKSNNKVKQYIIK